MHLPVHALIPQAVSAEDLRIQRSRQKFTQLHPLRTGQSLEQTILIEMNQPAYPPRDLPPLTGESQLATSDHDAVFTMMAEPAAVAMAAFTAADPTSRPAFDAHMERVQTMAGTHHWAITTEDETLIGTISTFPSEDGQPEVTYWLAQAHWGKGHASRALALVLEQSPRPVVARVALDSLGSRRVLEKAGFEAIGNNGDYAAGRGTETEELILRLS
ncbi:GNAT family N-acetyltransferase [Kribbella sp. NPDC056861]|uniref:GNAT family N-acetyltransferase n=1 Tax=Kribbella sp. NPDC056861 TaxID=3154857 RepID=UPI0034202D6F